MNIFNEKIIIITGAASGIGKGLSETFAQRGATVILTDIDEDGVKNVTANIVKNGGKAESFQLNVCDEAKTRAIWQQTAQKYGRLDYVINNAGYGMAEEAQDIPTEQWLKMVNINLMGVVYGAMEAFKIMKEQGNGHIVNVASLAGLIGSPGSLPYATTKFAVVGLSKSLRVEGAAFGVNVSALCPAFIETGIYKNAWTGSLSNELFKRTIPSSKIISLEEAIRETIKGIEKNEQLIIFPRYARVFYWMARLLPAKFEAKQIAGMARFRRIKLKGK
jgi:NAD(P)-dependent dehydrogenase (short-subunit alcohol dehydrogenase family)